MEKNATLIEKIPNVTNKVSSLAQSLETRKALLKKLVDVTVAPPLLVAEFETLWSAAASPLAIRTLFQHPDIFPYLPAPSVPSGRLAYGCHAGDTSTLTQESRSLTSCSKPVSYTHLTLPTSDLV